MLLMSVIPTCIKPTAGVRGLLDFARKIRCTGVRIVHFGGFWSITRFEDIVTVDKSHDDFSSEPAITIGDYGNDLPVRQFIAMDPPLHDIQRKAVQGVVAPRNLADLETIIRSRVATMLDELPYRRAL
jgi:cytochrome P450